MIWIFHEQENVSAFSTILNWKCRLNKLDQLKYFHYHNI